MVLDPSMLLQLTRTSADSVTANAEAAGNGARGGRAKERSSGAKAREPPKETRVPPHSYVDAWKSINGRPFSPWIDASVDIWDSGFGLEGPSPGKWLQMPPADSELDKAALAMDVSTFVLLVAFLRKPM